MSEYFILGPARDDEFCKIDAVPREYPSMAPASRGRSMSSEWPGDARLRMEPRHPGLLVPDVVFNPDECLMVTDRMKSFLEGEIDTPVEYLRFTLINHKGRVADDAMWIVNLLDSVECADRDKTDGTDSPFHPGEYQDLLELYVDEAKLPPDRKIFRVAECPPTILVREDLRLGIEEAGYAAEYFELGELIY